MAESAGLSSTATLSVDFGRGWVERGSGSFVVGVCDVTTPVFVVRSGKGDAAVALLEEVLLDDVYEFDVPGVALTYRSEHHGATIRIAFASPAFFAHVRYFTLQYFGVSTEDDDAALSDMFGAIRALPPASARVPRGVLHRKMLEGYQRHLCRAELSIMQRHLFGASMVAHGHLAVVMDAAEALTAQGGGDFEARELVLEVMVALVALGHAPLFRAMFAEARWSRGFFAGMWGLLPSDSARANEARLRHVQESCWGGAPLGAAIGRHPAVKPLTDCWVCAGFLAQEVLGPGCEECVRAALSELDSQLKAEIALAVSQHIRFAPAGDCLCIEGAAAPASPAPADEAAPYASLACIEVLTKMISGVANPELQTNIFALYYHRGMWKGWATALASGDDAKATARQVLYHCVTKLGMAGMEDGLTPCRAALMGEEGRGVLEVWVEALFLGSDVGDTDALFHLLGVHDGQGAQPGRGGAGRPAGDASALPPPEAAAGTLSEAPVPEGDEADDLLDPSARECLTAFVEYFCCTQVEAVARYLAGVTPSAAPDVVRRCMTLLRALINTAPEHRVGVVEHLLRAGALAHLSQALLEAPQPHVPKDCVLAFLQLVTECVVASAHPWVGAALAVQRVPQHLGLVYTREKGMLQSAVLGFWRRLAAPAAAAAPAARDFRRALCTALPHLFSPQSADASVFQAIHRAGVFDLQCDMEERVEQQSRYPMFPQHHTVTQGSVRRLAAEHIAEAYPNPCPAATTEAYPSPVAAATTEDATARSLEYRDDATATHAVALTTTTTTTAAVVSPSSVDTESHASTPCSAMRWTTESVTRRACVHLTPASDVASPDSVLDFLTGYEAVLPGDALPRLPVLPASPIPSSPSQSLDALFDLSLSPRLCRERSARRRHHTTASTLLDPSPCSAISNSPAHTEPDFFSEFSCPLPFPISPPSGAGGSPLMLRAAPLPYPPKPAWAFPSAARKATGRKALSPLVNT
eukprot:TRINITY_DN12336_c0_g1_i1.p1 TRINITY_DN12336_c0_g1~~TRINITY_DN12336_c0_g1_i1.p1  ORF type:complete len:982 (+),score=275.92 TRINITY_DN12336_c0_g1_i1:52-2997(+)